MDSDLDLVGLLEREKISKIHQSEGINSSHLLDRFNECPFLYQKCIGKDSTCIGDIDKFRGCDIFFEKYLTAPPVGYELR